MDELYTRRPAASQCWENLVAMLEDWGLNDSGFFIEPSAGDGAFYDLLPADRRVGLDLAPRHPEVIRQDFLQGNYVCPKAADVTVVVGNPPFGKRGKMAVKFLLKAAEVADIIAFILPVIFRKYFIHKQLPADFRLERTFPLCRDSFITSDGKPYSVNTEFQIWTRKPSGRQNLRLYTPPPIKHDDFIMWQYNNTAEALKVFANPFDFAVPCQGWQDYSRRETAAEKCEKHKQWMLIKANNSAALSRLRDEIDYDALSRRNTTSTPGFRKGDLVGEYISRYGRPGE